MKASLEGPKAIALQAKEELYYEDAENLLHGNLVDHLLGHPELLTDYYVGKCQTKPSDAMQAILNEAFDKLISKRDLHETAGVTTFPLELQAVNVLETIQEVMNDRQYTMNWKKDSVWEDARIGKTEKDGTWNCKIPHDYWQDLIDGYGKKLVSKDQMFNAETVVNQFRMSEVTSIYTGQRTDKWDDTKITYFDQVPLFFTWMERDFKVLIDRIIYYPASGNTPAYLEPIDFKTMQGQTFQFRSNAKRFRYDIQGRLYREGLLRSLDGLLPVDPFSFVVNSISHPYEPRVFTMSHEDQDIALFGATRVGNNVVYADGTIYRNTEIHGILKALECLDFYQFNGMDVHIDYATNPKQLLDLWT